MSDKHEYPSRYPPGTHWATDAAWEILDSLPPGRLNPTERAYLAGLITGRLIKVIKSNTTKKGV